MSDDVLPARVFDKPRANKQAAKRSMKRFVLLVLVPVLAMVIIALVYLLGGRFVATDNAYVKADKVPISSQVNGIIQEVLVTENQKVEAGQILYRLDASPYKAAVEKAQANLAQVRIDLAVLKATYQQKVADIELQTTHLAYARKEAQRQAELSSKHYVSESQVEDAEQEVDMTAKLVLSLQQSLHKTEVELGGNVNTPIEQLPNYLAAKATLDDALLNLSYVDVRASLPGVVNQPPKLGQYAEVGHTTMALIVTNHSWIEANFTETDLTNVQPGQTVTVKIDTYPDVKWTGKVDSVSPATGAEFSVIPAQNATGNWVKITQRVPVRIALDSTASLPELRSGLSAEVEIDTGHKRSLFGVSI